VLEARNRSHEFFPLPETLEILDGATPEEYLDRLRQALVRHADGHLTDDAAMILIERTDTAPGIVLPGDP
ncbi:SpoIIE family protein phosphatase, partial [Streptomyces sp. MCAF7]